MFEKTFQELKIGPVTVPNRLYMCPMGTSQAVPIAGEPGVYLPTEAHAYYYGERAKGGFGLIMQEAGNSHVSADYPAYLIMLSDDRALPGLIKIVDAVHEHGSRIFMQIYHIGSHGLGARTHLPLYAPSQVPAPESGAVPMEMEVETIREIQDSFVKAALNARRAGYDGVEVHCSHGYLLSQFLSPFVNRRTDEYGGSLENRMRIVVEILERVREVIGPNMALGIRFLADEMIPGGYSLDDAKEMCSRFEETGLLDYIDVDLGEYHTLPFLISPMYVPAGFAVEHVAAIKGVMKKIPVLGTPGGFSEPAEIERVLAEGKMDMVGLGRASIADPYLPQKMREGKVDEIRKCIRCMERCTGRIGIPASISCSINPTVGKEKEWGIGTLKSADRRKRVVVAGGGPGGLEASRVLSLRGHEVLLYEKEDLGGSLKLQARMPAREHYEDVIRWYQTQLEKNKVSVRIGEEVTPELIDSLKPDAVVVATGSNYRPDGFTGLTGLPVPGCEQDNVITPEQVVNKAVAAGKRVVILDTEGWDIGFCMADLLGEDREVTLVTLTPAPAMTAPPIVLVLPMLWARTLGKGVKFRPNSHIKEIRGKSVTLYNIYTLAEEKMEPIDTVILVAARASNDKLYKELKGRVAELYRIGDCVAPRRYGDAIYDGHSIGRLI